MITVKTKQNIPKGWQRVKLGVLLDAEKGKLPKRLVTEEAEGYLPYLTIKAIGGEGTEYAKKGDGIEAKEDDLLVIADGSRSGFLFIGAKGLVSSTFLRIRPKDSDALVSPYLYQLFHNLDFTNGRFRKGGAIPHFDFKQLDSLDIVLPPLPEQKKIAEILGVVDEEIQKTDEIITATEKLRHGLMHELFSRGIGHVKFKKTAIGEMPAGWQIIKLGEVATITRGGSPRPIESFVTSESDGLNWLKIGDIESGAKYIESTSQKIKKSGLSKTTLVHVGDFILSNSMSFGRPYIMKIDACIHDGWLAFKDIKTDLISSDFLYYLLSSKGLQDNFWAIAAGSGVKNLKKESVSNVIVALPSINEQQKISEVLFAIGEKISINQKIKAKLTLLKKGLMQDLLSGTVGVKLI